MTSIDLPPEWEITVNEPDEKQAIIPNPESTAPTAIISFDEFEGEYYVDLYHESIEPKMDELIGCIEQEWFDSKEEAIDCLERFAQDYRDMLSSE